ncbi:restriction endonuclease subunit S [Fusobacterium sp. MFO224]|uniref:restriction endonuclease subunit S n=1 Tax=Fusobacterium sp. MFO224 TaxID=3378070 RepID=UPI003853A8F0
MNKQKVPKLRFPEFTGEWEILELEKLIKICKTKYNPLKENINYKCIELENISKKTGILLGYTDSKKQKSIKNRFQINQVLFGKLRPYLKKYWKANFEGVCSSEIWVLEGINISNHYLYELIQTNKFNYIANVSSGSKMPRADWNYMANIPFKFPPLPEQEKIADFLTLFDKEIELEEKKLELLKENKKGYMQKIFSQEIRFKNDNGNDYPQWEEKKLGEVLIQGSKQKVKNISDYNKLTIKLNLKGLIKSKPTRKMADRRPFYIRKKGEIIIGKQNYFNGSIAIVSEEFDGFICSNAIMSFKVKKDNIEYIYNYISQNNYLEKYKFLANGTGQKELSEKDFLNFKMILPSLPEQEKIANFLSMAEEEIELMENKIEKLKEIKKGLLQQMFI